MFGYLIYTRRFNAYAKEPPNIRFSYQSIGSGGSVRMLMDKTVLIGASDAPLSNAQMQKAPGPVLRLPTVLGAVSIVYAKQQDRAKDDALENLLHRMRHEEQSTPQTKRFKSAKSSFAANKACHWLSGPPAGPSQRRRRHPRCLRRQLFAWRSRPVGERNTLVRP